MADENILDDNSGTLDKAVTIGKHEASFVFKNKTVEDLGESILGLFIKNGYKLESGGKQNGVYGKGSKIGRALLGAFIKRFAFKVTVTNDGDSTTLNLSKDGKGYMGGAIGVNQVKNEYVKITGILENYHSKTTID